MSSGKSAMMIIMKWTSRINNIITAMHLTSLVFKPSEASRIIQLSMLPT